MTRSRLLAAAAALVVLACAALPILRLVHRIREENPVVRGMRVAGRWGCGACHLPAGGSEIPNAGSRLGTVPAWGGGGLRKYAATAADAARIVREGSPAKASGLTPMIFMPAYGGHLPPRDVADVVAYVRALDGEDLPADPVARLGFEAASRHGCFHCHGPAGAGGVPNPGSLTGEIPGFLGPGYADLARSPEEFREWVRTGCAARVANNLLALRFLEAQRTSMPAFPREVLPDGELAAIRRYIETARAAGR